MRSLNVYIDQTLVGVLGEGDNIWMFTYDPRWASSATSFDLSPALPRSTLEHLDGSTLRPVQWYFDNLLPEERLRMAVARDAGLKDVDDSFALLTYLGAESTGSLTLLEPGVEPSQEFEMRELTDEQLSERIDRLPRDTLDKSAPKRMSVAGAQHKLLVIVQGDVTYEPVGATPSTYILKPDHPEAQTYPASAFNEYITMRMAHAARLDVPRVLLRYVPQPVYYIERFDRVVGRRPGRRKAEPLMPPTVTRLHVIDACQLLNKDRLFKHSGATLETLGDIVDATTNRLATRLALFRWLVFNVLVANDDSHLKNISFHVDSDGVRLAPHYDLLCTGAYHTKAIAEGHARWAAVPMTFPLPGARNFGDVTYEVVLEAATRLGVPTTTAARIVNEVTTRVEREFKRIVEHHDAQKDGCPPERVPHWALEARLLRVIEHITFKEMLQRLKPADPSSASS